MEAEAFDISWKGPIWESYFDETSWEAGVLCIENSEEDIDRKAVHVKSYKPRKVNIGDRGPSFHYKTRKDFQR